MSRSRAALGMLRSRVRRHRRRGGILMYHCVCVQRCDPWAICVSPKAFAEHMEVLAAARAPVGLDAFADDRAYTADGARLAVTFDDGYADNLTAALPILERFEIPATIFVVGNAVGRTREFWWDALQRAILDPPALPEQLRWTFGGAPRCFVVNESPDDAARLEGWRADAAPPVTARQKLFRTLWDAIVLLEPAAQDDAVDALLQWSGAPVQPPVAARLPVTAEQLAELAAHPLIGLGSHTLDHVSLTDADPSRQHAQITGGHRMVEELRDGPAAHFAYPFGRLDASARDIVRDSGIAVGCTTVSMPATDGDNRHALPRLHATEMDGDGFARWLRDDHHLLRTR